MLQCMNDGSRGEFGQWGAGANLHPVVVLTEPLLRQPVAGGRARTAPVQKTALTTDRRRRRRQMWCHRRSTLTPAAAAAASAITRAVTLDLLRKSSILIVALAVFTTFVCVRRTILPSNQKLTTCILAFLQRWPCPVVPDPMTWIYELKVSVRKKHLYSKNDLYRSMILDVSIE